MISMAAVRKPAGTALEFKVRRNDVPQRFRVVLGTRPAPEKAKDSVVSELPPPVAPPGSSTPARETTPRMPEAAGGHSVLKETRPELGITVADAERLSDADKRRMGVVVDPRIYSNVKEGHRRREQDCPLVVSSYRLMERGLGTPKISTIWCGRFGLASELRWPIGTATGWDADSECR